MQLAGTWMKSVVDVILHFPTSHGAGGFQPRSGAEVLDFGTYGEDTASTDILVPIGLLSAAFGQRLASELQQRCHTMIPIEPTLTPLQGGARAAQKPLYRLRRAGMRRPGGGLLGVTPLLLRAEKTAQGWKPGRNPTGQALCSSGAAWLLEGTHCPYSSDSQL